MNSKLCLLSLVEAALNDDIITPDELEDLCRKISNLGEFTAPAGGHRANQNGSDDVFEGRIKSFNPTEGYGFISCAAVSEKHGCDVFLHQRQFYACPVEIKVGDAVTFRLEISRQGKPQARDINKVF
jgi:cold shock CspA family protein